MEFFSSINLDDPLPEFPEVEDEKLRIFLTSRNVLSQYYNIRGEELQLSRRTVIAPFSGTFTQVNMEVGAFTNTGGRVARAMNTGELELEVPIDRLDADWVSIGDRVNVYSKSSEKSWLGTVIRKSQFVDPNTQSQAVFVHIKNLQGTSLLIGEYYRAEFPGRPVKAVMEVPRNIVFNTNEVFVIVENRLEKRVAEIVKFNEKTLLIRGLEEGEMLVMQPLINVLEGTLVERFGEGEQAPRKRQSGSGPGEAAEGGEKQSAEDK